MIKIIYNKKAQFILVPRYEWIVPIKWMEAGVVQKEIWLLEKEGTDTENLLTSAVCRKLWTNMNT